jgi:hypothetical protein
MVNRFEIYWTPADLEAAELFATICGKLSASLLFSYGGSLLIIKATPHTIQMIRYASKFAKPYAIKVVKRIEKRFLLNSDRVDSIKKKLPYRIIIKCGRTVHDFIYALCKKHVTHKLALIFLYKCCVRLKLMADIQHFLMYCGIRLLMVLVDFIFYLIRRIQELYEKGMVEAARQLEEVLNKLMKLVLPAIPRGELANPLKTLEKTLERLEKPKLPKLMPKPEELDENIREAMEKMPIYRDPKPVLPKILEDANKNDALFNPRNYRTFLMLVGLVLIGKYAPFERLGPILIYFKKLIYSHEVAPESINGVTFELTILESNETPALLPAAASSMFSYLLMLTHI